MMRILPKFEFMCEFKETGGSQTTTTLFKHIFQSIYCNLLQSLLQTHHFQCGNALFHVCELNLHTSSKYNSIKYGWNCPRLRAEWMMVSSFTSLPDRQDIFPLYRKWCCHHPLCNLCRSISFVSSSVRESSGLLRLRQRLMLPTCS